MIVGMDGLLKAEAVAAAELDGTVGDHLVGVHVARRARAGLIDVDGELVVEPSLGHLAAGNHEGLDLLPGERLAARFQFTQFTVGGGGGQLDQAQGMNQLRRERTAGNRKILHRPLRLGAHNTPFPANGPRPSNRVRYENRPSQDLKLVRAKKITRTDRPNHTV